MEAFHFTEMPYPYFPEDYMERYGSARVVLPNSHCDPKVMHELYNRYLDQCELADELGYNIMLNEHHQTVTCMDVIVPVTAGMLVRRTKQAKILMIGHPLGSRLQPVRVAEETAMLDAVSGGRILAGFVRGVPGETHPSNMNPTSNLERFREAYELIVKCWTTPEPFSWEGKHFQYRYVNVWPQPYTKPHPPTWTSGSGGEDTLHWAAERKVTYATLFAPWSQLGGYVAEYRKRANECGWQPERKHFAYALMCYVGETQEQAERDGKQLMWYLSTKQSRGFWFPPGHTTTEATKRGWKPGGKAAGNASAERSGMSMDYESLQQSGVFVVGNPDHVVKKFRELHDIGVGNVMMMMHAGPMSNEDVFKSQRLFAREVLPAIREFDRESEREPAAVG
ncbi:MAG: LLM class flavin-dependent oxidoreductase [Chloroflexi bacterium]|nr:LLM class flavin-dependent oxidoreductase [Chloroflexota bacterium]